MKQRSIKLENAMQEIKKILEAYDIAGVVLLHTPQVGEYFIKLNPSYSIATIDANEGAVRIKTNPDHTPEQKQQSIADTSNMLRILAQLGMENGLALAEASDMLDGNVKARHTKGKNITKNEKDN